MRKRIAIGRQLISEDSLFIISECGVTFNGDLDTALRLVRVTADAGANACKFIFWDLDGLFSRPVNFTYETMHGTETKTIHELAEKLTLTNDQWRIVRDYARALGIEMLATVNTPKSVDMAEQFNLPAFKVSSWDYNDHRLWRRIAETGKPVLADTGPVYLEELAQNVAIMQQEKNDGLVLIHDYHTSNPAEFNMHSIPYMRQAFDCLVGYSAPGRDDAEELVAIGLGATVIEKRLTMNLNSDGHHHAISLEPDEFRDWVKRMKNAHASLGRHGIYPSPGDLEQREDAFKSLVADRDLLAGSVFSDNDFAAKRPADGISPEFMHLIRGRVLKRSLKRNEPLRWEDV